MSANSNSRPKPVIEKNIKITSNENSRRNTPDLKFPDQYYPTSEEEKNPEIVDIWKRIDSEIKSYSNDTSSNKTEEKGLKIVKRNKTIRVFVSSTFTDFFSEREILIKQVFPELREWCFARNMDLIECDLRWGVPSDSTSDQTILTCMSELDRCHEDNDNQPFFIGMLSEKYGWVPTMDNLSDEIKTKYNWVPRVSITSMEFLHGALRCQNRNACFFIRAPQSISDIPAEYHEKFFESDSFSKLQLEELKQKLRKYHPNQVFDYNCRYGGIDDTSGRKRVKLDGLTEFGQKALEFLKNAIEKFYPDCKPIQTTNENDEAGKYEEILEDEKSAQNLHIIEKTNFFVNRERSLEILMNYIDSNKITEEFSMYANDMERLKCVRLNPACLPLIILGDEGCGKTALMALLAKKLIEKNENVFYFFYNASILSQSSRAFFALILNYFSKKLDIKIDNQIESLYSGNFDMDDKIKELAEKMGEIETKEVIIVDGFKYEQNISLENLPRGHSPNVKIIYTCDRKNTDLIEKIVGNGFWLKLELENFDNQCSRQFIESYLEKYNKRLDEKQMSIILNKTTENKLPLWLSYVCNELRVFGDFATINKKIEQLPIDMEELCGNIINRINSDFRNNLVREILCLISLTRYGLPENEVCLLMTSTGVDLNRLEWAQMFRSLKMFFRIDRLKNTQLIFLKNRHISSYLDKTCFKGNYETLRSYHLKLLEFFKNHSVYRNTAVLECCSHFESVNTPDEFVKFLKQEETVKCVGAAQRAFMFNKLRCPFPVNKDDKSCLKMCMTCAFKKGNLSQNYSNETSCYVCGGWVMGQSQKYVYKCSRHGFMESHTLNNMFKCCICRMNISVNPTIEKQMCRKALLCNFCYPDQCCCFSHER